MRAMTRRLLLATLLVGGGAIGLFLHTSVVLADDPPALNPFGKPGEAAPSDREDTVPGYVEMSDGSIHVGMLYLTRDKRLQVMDEKIQRQREVPLDVIDKVECRVKKEWLEKEWKFKETTNDEKMYTGRSYPAREYIHVITLQDGRTIEGPLSGIVFLQPQIYDPQGPNTYHEQVESQKFLLHKRDKGQLGDSLKSLLYVKMVKVGEDAYKEGKEKAAKSKKDASKAQKPAKSETTAE